MIAWMCSRKAATRWGVNASEARPRSRVCAGASMNSICLTSTCAIGFSADRPMAVSCSGVGVQSAENP